MVKTLHITNHKGTTKNLNNVFNFLNISNDLITEKCDFPLYINKSLANEIFNNYKDKIKNYKLLIFTDISMFARPFLQNMDKHTLNIIVYITNRFDWGIWGFSDQEYIDLYSNISNHPRIKFCSDNKYDQYYASLHNIKFYYNDIIYLTPIINDIIEPISQKMFIYNRGSKINDYKEYLNDIDYDIFGENYPSYRDEQHINEYLGYIHLPYQTNIQSLWENLGWNIIYFIPSKRFIKELIETTTWYHWEEKNKPKDIYLKSIELAEWYQPETSKLLVYFDNWDDLKYKIQTTNIREKKTIIHDYMIKNNKSNIQKWNIILNSFDRPKDNFPTIVTMFYNIRKMENTNIDTNRNITKYLTLANDFILQLPFPLFIAIDKDDDDNIEDYILTKRERYKDLTFIYREKIETTFFYQYLEKIINLQKSFYIHTLNLEHETPLYIILNSNKFHFMEKALDHNIFNSRHFIWMDFGINHVAREPERIYDWILYIPDKIKQLCISPYIQNNEPKIIFQTIYHNMAGGLFSGDIPHLRKYIELFKNKTLQIFNENWYQLDEAIMTIIQYENPDLFEFFYGDYEGIISNYMIPIYSVYLILHGISKVLDVNKTEYANHMLNYLYPFFEKKENQDMEYFYQFIEKNIIVNYYCNNHKINTNIISLINYKLKNNDKKMIELLQKNNNNINFYENKHLIILYY